VHGRTVFVLLVAREHHDQEDDEQEEAEQTTDGDTHGNETGLVWGEFVVVFGSGVVHADDDSVGVGVDGVSRQISVLEDDVISFSLGQIEPAALPDEEGDVLDDLDLEGSGLEVLDVGPTRKTGSRSTFRFEPVLGLRGRHNGDLELVR